MNITIPDEALEAAAKEIADANGWRDEQGVRVCREVARAACLAMLKAWPQMHIHEWQRPWLGGMSGTDIILPLMESSDD